MTGIKKASDTPATIRTRILIFVNSDALSSGYRRSGIAGIFEVPIAYYGRTYDEGKHITWRDGYKALGVLFAARARGVKGAAAHGPR